MDQTLRGIHHRILALEKVRRALFSGRCREISALSTDPGMVAIEEIRDFAGAMAKVEGELDQLWQAKRLLLIDEKSFLLKRHPELRDWSWLSPMIDVSKPPLRTSPTPALGMNF